MKKKTKILITGSAGFVGTNLIKHLSKIKKFEITATYNRKKPFKIKNVIYKKINLLDKKKVDHITKKQDIVFHLAGKLGTKKILKKSHFDIMKKNFNLSFNLANSAYKNKINKFVWLSSTTGYPDRRFLNEKSFFDGECLKDYEPIGLHSRFFEKLLKYYHGISNEKFKVIILRPSIIFGEFDDFNPSTAHFLPSAISDIVNDRTIYLYNNGKIKRDWLYVNDLVRIMINLSSRNNLNSYEVFNVGSNHRISNGYIVKKIIKFLKKSNAKILNKYVSKKEYGTQLRFFDLSKLKKMKLINKMNKFDSNLHQTINWYKKNIK